MTFASRRLRNVIIALAFALVLALTNWLYGLSLRDTSFLSGWILLGGMVFLALYNTRKKLPFMPFADSASWLQLHVYVGWLVVLMFLIHTSFSLPNGPLEVALWLLFVAVAGSGIVGIVLSRLLPNRIRRHGERIIFERIPAFRAQLAREVAELAETSIHETASNTLAQYYITRLQPFFARPGNFFSHLFESNEPLLRMQREMASLERYLNPKGIEILDQIRQRVEAKHNLDYQWTLQLVLKDWLFIHIPLTYGLLLVAAVHIVLAYAFSSGVL